MRKVYVIMTEQRMPQFEVRFQNFGRIEFAFTSKVKANEQMDVIHRMVESGEWYMNGGHSVEFDLVDSIRRTIKINHPNGTYSFYILQDVCLNLEYGI